MKNAALFLVLLFTFTIGNANAQKSLQCGLLTSFSLIPSSVITKPAAAELNLLNSINSSLKVQTYMSKAVNENSKKILVSLFTTATYDDLVKSINESKMTFINQKTISKNGVSFTCFNFSLNNKNITRIVFSEPKMTLCLVFDIVTLQKITDYDAFYKETINRLSFKNTGN